MKKISETFLVPLSIFLALLQFTGCSSSIELSSSIPDHPIIIDGEDNDWQSALFYLKKENIILGFYNDKNSLYLCMATNDRETQRKILGQGLTVWFDPEGSDDKNFGVHFPVGMKNRERPTRVMRDSNNPEQFEPMQELPVGKMEIVGPENEVKEEIILPSPKGYNAKIKINGGKLVYELQVPLVKTPDNPFAIEVTDSIISVGFETGESEFGGPGGRSSGEGPPPGEDSGGGNPPPMGRKGGRGMGGPPTGGRPGGGRSSGSSSTPLEMWIELTLQGQKL